MEIHAFSVTVAEELFVAAFNLAVWQQDYYLSLQKLYIVCNLT